jgi:membrane protein DedA with SNARE-associated domain
MNPIAGPLMKVTGDLVSIAVTTGWEERVKESVALLQQHGGSVLLMSTFLEGIGLPFPAVPALLTVGALSKSGKMSADLALGLPVVGGLLADAFLYGLGRFRGQQILAWLSRLSDNPAAWIKKIETMFSRHRFASLILSKFAPVFGVAARPMAAVAGMRTLPFLIVDALGTSIYTGFYVGLGYLFSDRLEQVAHSLVNAGHLGMLVVIAVASVLILRWPKWTHGQSHLCH